MINYGIVHYTKRYNEGKINCFQQLVLWVIFPYKPSKEISNLKLPIVNESVIAKTFVLK